MLSKKVQFIILVSVLLFSTELVHAEDNKIISSTGSNSDQNIINDALSEGGTVYLNAGTYTIDGPVYIGSNSILTGDPDAKIIVSSDISNPWFSPTIGVVNLFDPFNVQIKGFEIDGNCHNLNSDWANSPGHAHDQEQLIKVIGSSGNFGNNIRISNMKLHNSFGDGIQVRCIDGIICADNEIINTQHESIYYSASKNCKMIDNKMAVITSDGGRFDNCINGEASGNIVWKYTGTNNNGAWKGGANGFQIGDAGSSKGYNARKDWISTQNVEIHDNVISDPGRESILLGEVSRNPESNVYVYDNVFKNTEELKTMGIPVDDYSIENPPTVEQSEKIFTSLFDILNISFVDSGVTNQTEGDISYSVQKTDDGKIAGGIKIVGFKNQILINNHTYIPDNNSTIVKYEAVKTPSLNFVAGGVEKIDKTVDVKTENGTAYATLTVKMKYYTVSKNQFTGETTTRYKISEAKFKDSALSPDVLTRPTDMTGAVNEFKGELE